MARNYPYTRVFDHICIRKTRRNIGDCIKDSRKNIGVSWRSYQQLWLSECQSCNVYSVHGSVGLHYIWPKSDLKQLLIFFLWVCYYMLKLGHNSSLRNRLVIIFNKKNNRLIIRGVFLYKFLSSGCIYSTWNLCFF